MRWLRTSATIFRPPDGGETAALFPELARPGAAGIVAWTGARGTARLRARAKAAVLPFALVGQGLLRAPPRGRSTRPLLSALALEIAPGWPAELATPDGVLADRGWESPTLLAQAAAARQALVSVQVGGEWWHGIGACEAPEGDGYAVVALAEPDGSADDTVQSAMLAAALAENPADRIVILAPAMIGNPRLAAAAASGARIICRDLDPWALLDRAACVYSAGGEIGFLALIAGIRVTAFGPAFYTGWGATDDRAGVPRRPFRRSLDEIFAGAALRATRYRDPFRNIGATFEDVLAILADWRRLDEANRGIAVCVGMSFWKRRRIADFVRSSAGDPVFRRTAAGALAAARRGTKGRAIAGWASRLPAGIAEATAQQGVPLIRVEDGFIRSVGLGSDFLPPASLVFDSRGMYYDPRAKSDLEILLGEAELGPALVARAQNLAQQLVARGITKYNLADRGPGIAVPSGRRGILVPGQVEDDLSIQLGGGEVRTNLDLLAQVRAANPDAFIIYKPHPDVLAGHRVGAVSAAAARRFADVVVREASTAALLAHVDELHTMTSLAGFEALLRGRRVVVYGRPFYAGWGLTTDQLPCDRARRLSLDELVAGVLILYPRYLDPLTCLPCGPEVVIERLDHPELWRPGLLVQARRLQGAAVRRFGELRAMLPTFGSGPARVP